VDRAHKKKKVIHITITETSDDERKKNKNRYHSPSRGERKLHDPQTSTCVEERKTTGAKRLHRKKKQDIKVRPQNLGPGGLCSERVQTTREEST